MAEGGRRSDSQPAGGVARAAPGRQPAGGAGRGCPVPVACCGVRLLLFSNRKPELSRSLGPLVNINKHQGCFRIGSLSSHVRWGLWSI